MKQKSILLLLLFTHFHISASETSFTEVIETLKIELVKSVNPVNGEPSKYYKFSYPQKVEPSPGFIIIKKVSDEYVEFSVYIHKDGSVWSEDKVKEGIFGFDGGYAEKFEVFLAASHNEEEGKLLAKGEIIPFPRVVQDKLGHRIELKTLTADGEQFSFSGTGFSAKAKILVKSRSCKETFTHPLEADAQGNFIFIASPAVVGETEGPFELTFSGDNMQPLKMRHYWGKLAFCRPGAYKTLKNTYKFPDN